ncbi:cytochrome C oxidase mono-heme subunit/FixO [Isosphaera pallida ATCC 43644]|uniref:Cytochrome C oxidase mono-heme subunit/FixO n=1 Tax=Isosphaera pallida (strain ATCC 43644 / DSM 9630 / IS1B) TaxID=575540 RepID=E8R1U6_ISOPI|nr:cbb3-type cytochrome c oxidase subunit II [Isosphaera pallida]ADV61368.1 cytochrome C oxidase mono-heme subunit/FixO [Isosphaera pallida ATCC 43644]
MNSGPYLIVGLSLTCLTTWLGLSYVPTVETSNLVPVKPMQGANAYPAPLVGLAEKGRQVYIANGCAACHTQFVRPDSIGGDIARGWGLRPTLPGDLMFESPPLLGGNRNGPDLTNVALRRPDPNWHHRHLFYPRSESPNSIMPSFRHLYEYRKIVGQPSQDVLKTRDPQGNLIPWDFKGLPAQLKPAKGYEIVPTDDAKALVAYLMSRDQTTPVELVK